MKNKKIIKSLSLMLFPFVSLSIFSFIVFAAEPSVEELEKPPQIQSTACQGGGDVYCLNAPIGNLTEINIKGGNPLYKYIRVWYGFIIGSIGILATVIIMYGGLKWLTSRGNASQISDAKEKIIAAITGLLLAFLSYTILNLINPRLVQITTPGMKEINYTQNFLQNEIPFNDLANEKEYPIDTKLQGENTARLESNHFQISDGIRLDELKPEMFDVLTSIDVYNSIANPNGANPITITSGYRPGDPGNHGSGLAVDFSRDNETLNNLMNDLIRQGEQAGSYGQFPIYSVTFPSGDRGRIINESTHALINGRQVGNCWHIDLQTN